MRRRLQEAIDALVQLESQGEKSKTGGAGTAEPSRGVAELEAQAVELEQRARDLRSRISALKTGNRSTVTPSTSSAGSSH